MFHGVVERKMVEWPWAASWCPLPANVPEFPQSQLW